MSQQIIEGEGPSTSFTALVLAGRRGPTEPLAFAAGCSHKALMPIGGVPMLDRVLKTLRAVRGVERFVISTDEPTGLEDLAQVRELAVGGSLSFYSVANLPSASVLKYLHEMPDGAWLLVTTADHPLLTPEMLEYFCTTTFISQADVGLGVVAKSHYHARFPDSRRSFIRIQNEGFCGTNLFALRKGPGAVAATEFWNHAGQFRKRPWRLASTFGLMNLLLIALRRLDVEAARKRAEKLLGAKITVVQMPFVESAIDVDNPADLALVTQILAERESPQQA